MKYALLKSAPPVKVALRKYALCVKRVFMNFVSPAKVALRKFTLRVKDVLLKSDFPRN